MREILFRGKRTDNGEWVYGSYVEAKNSWHKFGLHADWIIPEAFANGGWFAIAQRFPVVGDTVGQYTGLNDRNGDKIFEGDIVKVNEKHIDVVVFCNGCFCMDRKLYLHEFTYQDSKLIRIIGNIHDNPQLLK